MSIIDNKINDSVLFIKANKKLLIDTFIQKDLRVPYDFPISIFMAGSPGAGKTEFANNFINKTSKDPIVRIDVDEIRKIIPQYDGKNSDSVQGAASLGVEKIHDYVLHKKYNFLLDGTFANYNLAYNDVIRSINKKRVVFIFYLYQDPVAAWYFTKIRELKEGRSVPKDFFIDSFFKSRENVNKIKSIFKDEVNVTFIEKNYKSDNIKSLRFNIDNIDNYLKNDYTKEDLNNMLREL